MNVMTRNFLGMLCLAVASGGLSAGCAASSEPADSADEGTTSDEAVAGSRCVEPQFGTCLDFNGGSGCAKNCEVQCQPAIKSCLAAGGGHACASRCGSGGGGVCQLPAANNSQSIYQVCPDLRVTRSELVCMDVLLGKQGLARTDVNINWAYSNCWIIANEGFDAPMPDLSKVVEQWLKSRGLL